MNKTIRQQIYHQLFYKPALARHYIQHHIIDDNSEYELARYDQVLNPHILRQIRFKAKLYFYLCLPGFYLLYRLGIFDPDTVPIDEDVPLEASPRLDAWLEFINDLDLDSLDQSLEETNPYDFYGPDDRPFFPPVL